jgi:hypothetical protein
MDMIKKPRKSGIWALENRHTGSPHQIFQSVRTSNYILRVFLCGKNENPFARPEDNGDQ